jgi:phage-related protein
LKRLDGEIWELRPIRDRILFAAYMQDAFVLLHYFIGSKKLWVIKAVDCDTGRTVAWVFGSRDIATFR